MLAIRDQENLVHSHQTAAAAKPLNQGARPLAPKTPGAKAPLRIPLNDENNPLTFRGPGKHSVAGPRFQAQKGSLVGKDEVRDKNAFATPAGPKNRAPLGNKTTNAKAFQTPAPQVGTTKAARTGRRSSTVRKLKQSTPKLESIPKVSENVKDDGVPEPEYAPPAPQPLADDPEDIPYDTTFPQFKGQNFVRGWERLYNDDYDIGEDGLTKKEREWRKEQVAYERRFDDLILQQVQNMQPLQIDEFPEEPCIEQLEAKRLAAAEKPKKEDEKIPRKIPTIQARAAAKALSQIPRPVSRSQSRSGTATRPRETRALTSKGKIPVPSNQSTMRHTAAVVTSRTTLGYSKGRNVAANLRSRSPKKEPKKASSSTSKSIISPGRYMELYGPPPFGTEMWLRCKTAGLFDPGDLNQEILDELPACLYEEDEESANFQLAL